MHTLHNDNEENQILVQEVNGVYDNGRNAIILVSSRFVQSSIQMSISFFFCSQATKAEAKDANIKGSNKAMLADECREYLRTAYDNNPKLFQLIFPILEFCSKNLKSAVDIFFFDVLPVTPANVRLVSVAQSKHLYGCPVPL